MGWEWCKFHRTSTLKFNLSVHLVWEKERVRKIFQCLIYSLNAHTTRTGARPKADSHVGGRAQILELLPAASRVVHCQEAGVEVELGLESHTLIRHSFLLTFCL